MKERVRNLLCFIFPSSWFDDSVRLDVNGSWSESDSSLSKSALRECLRRFFGFYGENIKEMHTFDTIPFLMCGPNYARVSTFTTTRHLKMTFTWKYHNFKISKERRTHSPFDCYNWNENKITQINAQYYNTMTFYAVVYVPLVVAAMRIPLATHARDTWTNATAYWPARDAVEPMCSPQTIGMSRTAKCPRMFPVFFHSIDGQLYESWRSNVHVGPPHDSDDSLSSLCGHDLHDLHKGNWWVKCDWHFTAWDWMLTIFVAESERCD